VEGRSAFKRVLAADPRSLDVRSTSRGRASSEEGRGDPFGRSEDHAVCGALMNGLAGPVVARRRMPLDSLRNGNREIEEMDVTDVDPQRPRLRGVRRRRGRCGSTSVTPSNASRNPSAARSRRFVEARPNRRRPRAPAAARSSHSWARRSAEPGRKDGPCALDGLRRLTCGCSCKAAGAVAGRRTLDVRVLAADPQPLAGRQAP